jgi:NADH-quinone oxidoreductase subunit F
MTMELIVGTGTCGVSAGAGKVLARLKELEKDASLGIAVRETGCIGACYREPLVEVRRPDGVYLMGDVTPEVAEKLARGEKPRELAGHLVREGRKPDADNFLAKQKRIVLEHCGVIDPRSIDQYEALEGYQALTQALRMTPEAVIDLVKKSGLRGRGGGGFPSGSKWEFTRKAQGDRKYIICNADEGDPGAFMDRSVLEGDPHAVLEGMIICAYAIGAVVESGELHGSPVPPDALRLRSATPRVKGYIYCRAEYPLALVHLRIAIEQARAHGHLGTNIHGSGFDFEVVIKEGAGAFVCGEETALMASIEGRRGMPRFRPPFPAQSGLWGKPTNINNVETYANVPWIVRHGWEAFAGMGTERSKGSKVFALAGKIRRGGLVEVPMGMTIRELVEKVGGGVGQGHTFKAVQMGGPSGGCIPASMADTPIDYERITATGAIMGSGGLVVMDDSTCMVEVARFFLSFTQKESCGKCTFCRVGTMRMLEILERIVHGQGQEEDLERLLTLGQEIKDASLCGLGQTAPNPVLTTIRYFREEYEAHIRDRKCPALSCNALITFSIDEHKCTGCTLCAKQCAVNAISGERKEVHVINQETCIRCGKCFTVCNFDAVVRS